MEGNIWEMVKMIPENDLNKLSEYVKMEQARRKGEGNVRKIDAESGEQMNMAANQQMAGGSAVDPYAALQSQDMMNMNRQFGM